MLSSPLAVVALGGFGKSLEVDCFGAPKTNSSESETKFEEAFFNIFQNKVRRASRYVKFANFAARHCASKLDPDFLKSQRVGFYLGTGLGNVPDVLKFTCDIFSGEGLVGPAHFVNTVSNAGLFYVARSLGVECSTNVISQESVSFEAALLSAGVALLENSLDLAIVGGVDVLQEPLEDCYLRFHSKGANSKNLGEGSVFVALMKNPSPNLKVLGWLKNVGVEQREKPLSPEGFAHVQYCSVGFDTKVDEGEVLAERHGLKPFEYRKFSGDYPTASAFALCRFLESEELRGQTLLHLNTQQDGLTGYFLISKEA